VSRLLVLTLALGIFLYPYLQSINVETYCWGGGDKEVKDGGGGGIRELTRMNKIKHGKKPDMKLS